MSNISSFVFTIIISLMLINPIYCQKKENPLDKLDIEKFKKKLDALEFESYGTKEETYKDKLLKYGLSEYGYRLYHKKYFDNQVASEYNDLKKEFETEVNFVKDSLKLFETIAVARQTIIKSRYKEGYLWALPYFTVQEQNEIFLEQKKYLLDLEQERKRQELEKVRQKEVDKNRILQEKYAQQRANKEKERQKNLELAIDFISVLSNEEHKTTFTGNKKIPDTDFESYKSCSEAGNTGCYETLGLMYALGKGTKRDFSKGKKWLKKAGYHMCYKCWGNGDLECSKCKGTGKNYYDSGRENGDCKDNCRYGKVDCYVCSGIGVYNPD